MSGLIIGRYYREGVMHVAEMHDAPDDGVVRLIAWCGGGLSIDHDIEVVAATDATDHVTCVNCRVGLSNHVARGYPLPTGVRPRARVHV